MDVVPHHLEYVSTSHSSWAQNPSPLALGSWWYWFWSLAYICVAMDYVLQMDQRVS